MLSFKDLGKSETKSTVMQSKLIQAFSDLLLNNKEAGPKILENLWNADYDFKTKEGFYRILNEEERKIWDDLYERRKKDPIFNQRVQYYLLLASGGFLLGMGIGKLIEYLEN